MLTADKLDKGFTDTRCAYNSSKKFYQRNVIFKNNNLREKIVESRNWLVPQEMSQMTCNDNSENGSD